VTTIVWITTAFVTPPTDRATLVRFYEKVRPAGPGWAQIRREAGLAASPDSLPMAMLSWVLGCTFVYAALFGVGSFLYGRTSQALVWGVLFVISALGLIKLVPQMWASRS
jgi:SSS family solute:Na+ symporter